MCCLATTGEGPAHQNKSLICVPMDTPGVQVSTRIKKLGMHSSDTVQVTKVAGSILMQNKMAVSAQHRSKT